MKQVTEAMGSGPFRFLADERVSGSRVAFARNADYVPRKDGKPSFNAGPKIAYIDRVVWNFIPDPATAAAATISDPAMVRMPSQGWIRNRMPK